MLKKIIVADWKKDTEILKGIRQNVFVMEQKVPADLEWDELDETATHFIIYGDGSPVGVARLTKDGQIGRMAVIKLYRKQGFASALLSYVLKYASKQKMPYLYVHAQIYMVPFYSSFGFIKMGVEFDEAGIKHQKMDWNLFKSITANIRSNRSRTFHILNKKQLQFSLNALFAESKKEIIFFSHDLSPKYINNKLVSKSITNLIKDHRGARIKIIVFDPKKAISKEHFIVEKARYSGLFIEVRKINYQFQNETKDFLIIDNNHCLIVPDWRKATGEVHTNDRELVTRLSQEFNKIWETCEPATEFKSIGR